VIVRGRGPMRRAMRRNKHWVWTAVLMDDTAMTANTDLDLIIVTGADWSALTAGNDEATFTRARGWFQVRAGTQVPVLLHAYVALYDKDETSKNAKAVTTYVEEDILWTGGGLTESTSAIGQNYVERIELDIPVKRKMRAGQELRLVVRTNVGANVSGVVRGLMQLAG